MRVYVPVNISEYSFLSTYVTLEPLGQLVTNSGAQRGPISQLTDPYLDLDC